MLTRDDLRLIQGAVRDVIGEEISPRLDRVESKAGAVEARLDGVESRLGRVEDRLDKVERRLGSVEFRLVGVEDELGDLSRATAASFAHVERRLDGLEGDGEDDGAPWLPPFRRL